MFHKLNFSSNMVHTSKQNLFTYVLMVCPALQDHLRFHILWLFLLSHKHYILYQASTFLYVSLCSESSCLILFRGYDERNCYVLFYPLSIPENRGRYNISQKEKQMKWHLEGGKNSFRIHSTHLSLRVPMAGNRQWLFNFLTISI